MGMYKASNNMESPVLGGKAMKTKGLVLSLLALLLLWPVTAAFADDPVVRFDDGQIFVEEDVSLGPGDTINGDLGVFDGDLDMACSAPR